MFEVCRKEWEECVLRQDPGFNVNEAALKINADFLERARGAFDLAEAEHPRLAPRPVVRESPQSASASGGRGKGRRSQGEQIVDCSLHLMLRVALRVQAHAKAARRAKGVVTATAAKAGTTAAMVGTTGAGTIRAARALGRSKGTSECK